MSMFDALVGELFENGLQDVAVTIHDEEIDNETLPLLTEDMLDKMGIRPLGKRLKVMNILNKIKNQENVITDISGSILASATPFAPPPGIPLETQATTPPGWGSAPPKTPFSVENVVLAQMQLAEVPLPTPLPYPKYSRVVVNAEETGTILLQRAQLIRESARFYLSLKHDLSKEYRTISMHLLKRFPDLKDAITLPGASCNYTKLVKDLAQSVRNHKRLAKKKSTTDTIVDNAKEILIDEDVQDNVVIDTNLLERTLSELKKESKKNKPSKEHIKQLLTATVGNFTDFINTMPTIATILESYPVLTNPCWMIFQASLVLEFPNFEDYVQEKIKLLFVSIYNLMVGNNKEADEELTEDEQVEVIQYMESQVNGKKNISIFNMIQPGKSMEPSIANAPSIVTTKTVAGIDQAFLYVDAVLVCEVTSPTVVGLLTLWLATHYVLNIQYGKKTNNVAMVLEDCMLMERGQNSIQNLQKGKGKAKSRKISRCNKLQTFHGRLKAAGLNI